MELPTYTNIWKIEKRLYKLYDFRLPMPLPIGQVAAFLAIAVPYMLILTLAGMPFSHTWVWLYVLPPGVLAWLVTRPVLEGKRLPELVLSQLRYLSEPRTWCRMAPLAEKDQLTVVATVWRRAPASALDLSALTEPAAAATVPEPVLVPESAPRTSALPTSALPERCLGHCPSRPCPSQHCPSRCWLRPTAQRRNAQSGPSTRRSPPEPAARPCRLRLCRLRLCRLRPCQAHLAAGQPVQAQPVPARAAAAAAPPPQRVRQPERVRGLRQPAAACRLPAPPARLHYRQRRRWPRRHLQRQNRHFRRDPS